MKFFFPIRTGTLQRERSRIAAKRGQHLRRVVQLDAQIDALQNERNAHFMAASAYADAETTLDLQDAALTIDDVDPTPPLLGGIDREAHQYWRNHQEPDQLYPFRENGIAASATTSSEGDHG